MLQFVTGRAGSGKTEYMRRRLVEMSLAAKSGLLMIVPEQYSFETEKAIMRMAGPQYASGIEVMSFTRLSEAVFRAEGGLCGKRLSEGGRRVLMSTAIKDCAENLQLFNATAKNGRFTELMLTSVNEMKLCGITAEELGVAADELEGTGLAKKLADIALIYSAYDALIAGTYLDSRDDLTRLAEKLRTSDFFCGMTVAVDCFDGFTAQETEVLSQIMRKAESVTVSLCTDGLPENGTELFSLVNRTRRKLSAQAKKNGIKLAPDIKLSGGPRFKYEELKALEEGLFSRQNEAFVGKPEHVHIFRAKDPYEEAEYVSAEIRRLAAEKGVRYRDISIICRSPERYYGSLDVALLKRDIPSFVSEPDRVDFQPVMRFVLGAFTAVRSGFASEDIFRILKTGISGFDAGEISELENYAFLWKINGAGWKKNFTKHPRGFGCEFATEDAEKLERLNLLRERIMSPLLKFSAVIKDASGKELCEAVYSLLCGCGIDENLPEYCKRLEKSGDPSRARMQVRIWELLMKILDEMAMLIGDRKLSWERFYELLKEVIEAQDVSEIPQSLDEVLFGTVEQVRQSAPKAAFIIGAVQGEFPRTPKPSGVLSDTERRELISMELPLSDPLEQKTLEERYLAYSVACAASEDVYITYFTSADGGEFEPSELISEVKGIFPKLEELKELGVEYFANSLEAAFTKMAAGFNDNTPEEAALKKLFENEPQYSGKLFSLEAAAGKASECLETKETAEALFGQRPYFSASQIETFYNCRFKYFCRYGLNAKDRKPAEVDALRYGTLMHYIFEQVFRLGLDKTAKLDGAALSELVHGFIAEYADRNMGGFSELSGRERYRLSRMERSAMALIRRLEEEFSQSSFKPEYFELKLAAKTEFPPLVIKSPQGRTAEVGGVIDRVDAYSGGSARFTRVVDYKTGKKEFRLSDVLYGINMQMIIYLAALCESKECEPAGVLYMPAAGPMVAAERGESEGEIKKQAQRQLRMNGIVLAEEEIVAAMESKGEGKFIPASVKDGKLAKSESLYTRQELLKIMEYSKRKVGEMTDALCGGDVQASPFLKNKTNACRYCEFAPVCGKEFGGRDVDSNCPKKNEALEKIDEELSGAQKH